MLEHDKIDINEGIGINKNISTSKKCYLCGYWYFLLIETLIIKNTYIMVATICL